MQSVLKRSTLEDWIAYNLKKSDCKPTNMLYIVQHRQCLSTAIFRAEMESEKASQ